jgi:hypothetical protein
MTQFVLEIGLVIVALFLGLILVPAAGTRPSTGPRLRRPDGFVSGVGGWMVPQRRRYRH